MIDLTVLLTDVSDVPPDISNIEPGITEHPLFIPFIIIVVIIVALVLRRLVFDNTHAEYKHNPDE